MTTNQPTTRTHVSFSSVRTASNASVKMQPLAIHQPRSFLTILLKALSAVSA